VQAKVVEALGLSHLEKSPDESFRVSGVPKKLRLKLAFNKSSSGGFTS
jgi:hypothetical protein